MGSWAAIGYGQWGVTFSRAAQPSLRPRTVHGTMEMPATHTQRGAGLVKLLAESQKSRPLQLPLSHTDKGRSRLYTHQDVADTAPAPILTSTATYLKKDIPYLGAIPTPWQRRLEALPLLLHRKQLLGLCKCHGNQSCSTERLTKKQLNIRSTSPLTKRGYST